MFVCGSVMPFFGDAAEGVRVSLSSVFRGRGAVRCFVCCLIYLYLQYTAVAALLWSMFCSALLWRIPRGGLHAAMRRPIETVWLGAGLRQARYRYSLQRRVGEINLTRVR